MAAVDIGWHPNKVDFKSGLHWIGVWRGQRDDPDPLVDLPRSSLAELAVALELNKSEKQWPLYRYGAGPSGEFWDNLHPWLEALEDEVRGVWDATADDIELILHRGIQATEPT